MATLSRLVHQFSLERKEGQRSRLNTTNQMAASQTTTMRQRLIVQTSTRSRVLMRSMWSALVCINRESDLANGLLDLNAGI